MNRTNLLLGAAGALLVAALVWLLFFALPRWADSRRGEPETAAVEAPAETPVVVPTASPTAEPAPDAVPKITVRLFYLSGDGRRLEAREREVDLVQEVAPQARHILEAQLGPAPGDLVSAVPEGTQLKEIFVTPGGRAFVDLSGEVSRNHRGGSLDELLTVYTIVNALTENLPAISEVQILVDGREVDTIAGHVDLRRPLSGSARWLAAEPTGTH